MSNTKNKEETRLEIAAMMAQGMYASAPQAAQSIEHVTKKAIEAADVLLNALEKTTNNTEEK